MTNETTPTMGQSLTLQCEAITVRGITSRVDIVWRRDGREHDRTNGVNNFRRGDTLVYTDSYTTGILNESDINVVYQCEVTINSKIPIISVDNFTLESIDFTLEPINSKIII